MRLGARFENAAKIPTDVLKTKTFDVYISPTSRHTFGPEQVRMSLSATATVQRARQMVAAPIKQESRSS